MRNQHKTRKRPDPLAQIQAPEERPLADKGLPETSYTREEALGSSMARVRKADTTPAQVAALLCVLRRIAAAPTPPSPPTPLPPRPPSSSQAEARRTESGVSTKEKPLPQSVESERGLLGLLASGGEWGDVLADAGFLMPADFYVEWHGVVWQAARALRADGTPVHPVSILDKLVEWEQIGEGKPVGDISDVTECANNIPMVASARAG